MKRLLLLSGGVEAQEAIHTAHRMGLSVTVADGDPEAPGLALADDGLIVNVYDHDAVRDAAVAYHRRAPLDAVITVAADNPRAVAAVSDALGLVGPTPETAHIATDKLDMKRSLARRGVPLPWFEEVTSREQIKDVLRVRPGAYVLKPIDSRGSRGVVRLASAQEVDFAWDFSRAHTSAAALILEEWLTGPQLSVEAVVWDGRAHICGVADRNYQRLAAMYPHVVEDGGETPSEHSPDLDDSLEELMTAAAEAIALGRGTIKGDVVVSDGQPVIIEVAARLSGGYFCTHTIPLVYGYPIIEQAIRISLGETPQLPPTPLRHHAHQANRFLFLPPGRVVRVRSFPRAGDDVVVAVNYVDAGQRIPAVTNHTQRGGMVLCVCSTRAEAIQRCEQLCAEIDVEIESTGDGVTGAR